MIEKNIVPLDESPYSLIPIADHEAINFFKTGNLENFHTGNNYSGKANENFWSNQPHLSELSEHGHDFVKGASGD